MALATLPDARDAASDAAIWRTGDRVGEFEIVRRIGRGGMGVVYLATDRRLHRNVALKSLPSALADNTELRERLKREARAAATITDSAVATVYSLEEVDGHLLLASEYHRRPARCAPSSTTARSTSPPSTPWRCRSREGCAPPTTPASSTAISSPRTS